MKEQPAHPRAVLIFCSFFSPALHPVPSVRCSPPFRPIPFYMAAAPLRNVDAGGVRDAFPGCGALGWAGWRSGKNRCGPAGCRLVLNTRGQGALRREIIEFPVELRRFLSNRICFFRRISPPIPRPAPRESIPDAGGLTASRRIALLFRSLNRRSLNNKLHASIHSICLTTVRSISAFI